MTVTNEQIQQYREIVDNAPEGATHVDTDGCYIKQLDYEYYFAETVTYFHWGEDWVQAPNPVFLIMQSLDNLRTIIAQHDEIQRLRDMINKQTKED